MPMKIAKTPRVVLMHMVLKPA